MRIGIAGPIDLTYLEEYIHEDIILPECYSFPYIGLLVKNIIERGYSVSVFTTSDKIDNDFIYKSNRLNIYIISRIKSSKVRAFTLFKSEIKCLKSYMDQDDCSLIHSHWLYEFSYAAVHSNKKTIVTSHDAPFNVIRFEGSKIFRILRLLLSISVLKNADILTTVSKYTKQHIMKYYRINKEIQVISNGVPESIFEMHKPLKDKQNDIIMFATILNGWTDRKNGQFAIDLFESISKDTKNIKMFMYGRDFGAGEKANQYYDSRNYSSNIEFRGYTSHENILNFLSNDIHLLLHPSKEESDSVAIIESISLGIPVIAGINSGGVKYTLGEGKAGVLINLDDFQKSKLIVNQLINNSDKLFQLSQYSFEYAKENYNIKEVVDKYEILFKTLTEKVF